MFTSELILHWYTAVNSCVTKKEKRKTKKKKQKLSTSSNRKTGKLSHIKNKKKSAGCWIVSKFLHFDMCPPPKK